MSKKINKEITFDSLPLKKQTKLLSGDGRWKSASIPECNIQGIKMSDGPAGVKGYENDSTKNDIVCFPSPALNACSWDKDLFKELGEAFAYEAIKQGVNLVLAPGINIKRNPLCGRNFEYLSEDPLLSGELASSFISSCQENGVGTCLKHFVANNTEHHRFLISSEIDTRALREIYLKGFEIAIKEANPWAVMCAYNRLNGTYCCQNEWLIDKVLRKEWGYNGVTISDWNATPQPIIAHSKGLDLEMPCFEKTRAKAIAKAVKNGLISKERFSEETSRIVEFSKKGQQTPTEIPLNKKDFAREVAYRAAIKSIVLAKNNKILPLSSLKGVCVIGAFAKEPHFQGKGSAEIKVQKLNNFLDVCEEELGHPIPFAPGFDPFNKEEEENLRLDALDLASTHKTVILFLGTTFDNEREGKDVPSMRLPENQIRLVEAIASQNKNIILVLSSGSAIELPFINKCKAVLLTYLSGEAGAKATLDLLLGNANPEGHLAETWPIRYLDCPSALCYPGDGEVSLYKESLFVGYRYYLSAKREVLFPFGYGLSYSTFKLTDLKLSKANLRENGSIKVTLTISNVGKYEGGNVVQLYIRPHNERSLHPLRELKAYQKVFLSPGKSKKISFTLSYKDFAHFGVTRDTWVVSDDTYSIDIGFNCRDIELSNEVKVFSPHHSRDTRFLLPSYFCFPANGAYRVSDREFEMILNHSVFKNIRRKKKKFSRNSTFNEMEGTLIIKRVLNKIKSTFPLLPNGEFDEESFDMFLDCPIRVLLGRGYTEKKLNAIIALANKKPFSALFALIF